MSELDLAAIVHGPFQAPGIEVTQFRNEPMDYTTVRLRLPIQEIETAISDESAIRGGNQIIVADVENQLRQLQRGVSQAIGLGQMQRQAVALSRGAGWDAALRRVIDRIEEHRSQMDGSLPRGWSDVLDLIKNTKESN